MQVIVMAKAPVAGMVKTRLCPPLTPNEAAEYAAALLADTLDAVAACAADEKFLALDGSPGPWLPAGFRVVPQRGETFNERLAMAWRDAGGAALQIGMDTPQVTAELLDASLAAVQPGRAVLGQTRDGGWWALGLSRPDAAAFDRVPMSRSDTCDHQRAQLLRLGYDVHDVAKLVDVDHFADAVAVAAQAPHLRSTRLLQSLSPESVSHSSMIREPSFTGQE